MGKSKEAEAGLTSSEGAEKRGTAILVHGCLIREEMGFRIVTDLLFLRPAAKVAWTAEIGDLMCANAKRYQVPQNNARLLSHLDSGG